MRWQVLIKTAASQALSTVLLVLKQQRCTVIDSPTLQYDPNHGALASLVKAETEKTLTAARTKTEKEVWSTWCVCRTDGDGGMLSDTLNVIVR